MELTRFPGNWGSLSTPSLSYSRACQDCHLAGSSHPCKRPVLHSLLCLGTFDNACSFPCRWHTAVYTLEKRRQTMGKQVQLDQSQPAEPRQQNHADHFCLMRTSLCELHAKLWSLRGQTFTESTFRKKSQGRVAEDQDYFQALHGEAQK